MEKLVLKYPVIVEGKYDKIKLSSIINGTVITTDGFGLFKNGERLSLLKKLAEKIRFSDPMSHESLSSCEKEIEEAVRYIVATLRADPDADVSKKISEVQALLEYRNDRCKILK